MEYGARMMFGYALETGEVSHLHELKQIGFDFVELKIEYLSIEKESIVHTIEELKKLNLRFAVHLPLHGIVLFHPEEGVTDGSLAYFKKIIAFFESYSPLYYVLHQEISIPDLLESQIVFEKVYECARKHLKILSSITSKPVYLENNSGKILFTPKEFEFVNNKLCFDIEHAARATLKEYPTRLHSKKTFYDFGAEIIHLSNFKYVRDVLYKHLDIRIGAIDYDLEFKKIKTLPLKYIVLESRNKLVANNTQKMEIEDIRDCLAFCKKNLV